MISLHEGRGSGGGRKKKKAVDRVLQLRLQVTGCEPPIWRTVLVRESMWLSRLHDTIQVLFDWFDYQTHVFVLGKRNLGNPFRKDEFVVEDDRDVALADLELDPAKFLAYRYHFGDGWQVDVLVESVTVTEKGKTYPLCLAGERAGPPEDCGGIEAFHDMLACIKEPHTDLGREWIEWLGPLYVPEKCDVAAINKALRRLGK